MFLKWFFFLSKRLYKKATFLILLFLIPLAGLALKIASGESSGFVRVALVNWDKGDSFSEEMMHDLVASTDLIRFTEYEQEADARQAMNANRADAIWIFPKDMRAKMDRYIQGGSDGESVITVLFREESVINRMSLERLSGTLYPYLSRQAFLHYIRSSDTFDLSALRDEEIFFYYDRFHSENPLFSFAYPDGGITASDSAAVHFLTAPVRGILSVIVVLCGMAAAMLFLQDEIKGTFSRAKPSSRLWISLASQLSAVLGTAIMMLVAVYFLGANVSFFREAVILLLFIANTTLFSTLLQLLFRQLNVLATAATTLTVFMLIVCPIFFDTAMFKKVQLLFPSTYYINSAYNNTFLLYSLFYGLILSGILFAVSLQRYRR